MSKYLQVARNCRTQWIRCTIITERNQVNEWQLKVYIWSGLQNWTTMDMSWTWTCKQLRRKLHKAREKRKWQTLAPSYCNLNSKSHIYPNIKRLQIFPMTKTERTFFWTTLSMSLSSEGWKQKQVKLYYWGIMNSKFNTLNINVGILKNIINISNYDASSSFHINP
jgi:hypothetical protein